MLEGHRLNQSVSRPGAWLTPGAITGLTIALTVVVRIIWLLADCPLNLAADEAHYWDWSRHLDWSYYSKGPLVAWMIRLSTTLFGEWSEQVVGSPLLAVRLPAITCGAAFLASLYVLGTRILGTPRHGLATVLAALTLPGTWASGTLMTIDAPFSALWGWALVAGHAALFRGRRGAWPLVGLLVGLGILAKYTMVLWAGGLAAFLLLSPQYRVEWRRPGVWIAAGITALCCLPILIWNIQHDWITLRHVGTQAGANVMRIHWLGPLRFLGEQGAVLLLFWLICWLGAAWKFAPGRGAPAEYQFLWWTSIPVFAVFMAFTIKTPGQVNWPAAAYVGGLVLAVGWLIDAYAGATPRWRWWCRFNLIVTTSFGVALTVCTHNPAIARPLLLGLANTLNVRGPCPLRALDPTTRLRGWQHLADAVDHARASAGDDPVLAAVFWTIPGELAVYCHGHPNVYCIGVPLAQRMSQYDLWRPSPVWDPEVFRGRSFIIVGDLSPAWTNAFEKIESSETVWYREAGHPVAFFQVSIARGFRGFGPPSSWTADLHY